MKNLFDTAPGFDEPIAVLKHCHDRIRKQLRTLENLLNHLPKAGTDVDSKQAATAVMRYFEKAAILHHEDEEQDLLPVLQAIAEGEDALLLQSLLPGLLHEHKQMESDWQVLHRQLEAIAAGESAELSCEDVNRFATLYAAHMEKEESHIAPMAKRLFSSEQMSRLGDAMRARRNITE